MKIKINEKEYEMKYTSTVGVNYTYEVEFDSTIFADSQKLSQSSMFVRIAWAVIKTDNEVVECTFDTFRKAFDDKMWKKVFAWLNERTLALTPAETTDMDSESKNDLASESSTSE